MPDDLADLADDPYRSLAGFVRFKGGFIKTATPYMEFQWADYFRPLIRRKQMAENFDKAVKRAAVLAHAAGAAGLPGYVPGPGAAAPRGPSGED